MLNIELFPTRKGLTLVKNSSKFSGFAMLAIFPSLILNADVFSLIAARISAAMLEGVVPSSPLSS